MHTTTPSSLPAPDGTVPPLALTGTQLAAVLVYDSRDEPLPSGVRSSMALTRQMIFNAGEFELDLRLTPSNGKWMIEGQILGPAAEGNVFLIDGGRTHSAPLNDLSEFYFPSVHGSRYTLQVQLGQMAITVPDVDVC